jgi:hypothetical protein
LNFVVKGAGPPPARAFDLRFFIEKTPDMIIVSGAKKFKLTL